MPILKSRRSGVDLRNFDPALGWNDTIILARDAYWNKRSEGGSEAEALVAALDVALADNTRETNG